MYWFYTAYNSPTVYTAANEQNLTAAMSWSATALGGAVASVIMILVTPVEFYTSPRHGTMHRI